jgi:acyl-coenzyme A thioesterase PaaI-like protein
MTDTHSDSSAPAFFTRYGFSRTGDVDAPLIIEPYDEICAGGALRATVVASAIDLVGGLFTREIAGTDATFTSDLSLRIPSPGRPKRLLARGQPLRTGRRLVSTEVRLESDGAVYAYGQTTFARIPRAPEQARDLEQLSTPLVIKSHPLDRPLDQEVGLEIANASEGHLLLPFRPALLNPEGVLQGALVALHAECSALTLANAHFESPHVLCELDLRYLASAAVGPVGSQARWIGSPSAGMIAVELRDRGRDNRLTTAALIRIIAAP